MESIALLGGRKNRLKLWNVTEEERKDIEVAQEIEEEHIERLSPFVLQSVTLQKEQKLCLFAAEMKTLVQNVLL